MTKPSLTKPPLMKLKFALLGSIYAASALLLTSSFPAFASGQTLPGFVWIGAGGDASTGAPGTRPPGTGAATTGTTGAGTVGAPGTNAGTPGQANPTAETGDMGTAGGAGISTNSANSTNANSNAAASPQSSIPSPGLSGAASPFSLAQTVRAALQSSADIQIATRNVEIDRKRADEATAASRPNIDANGTFERFDQATLVKIGAGPAIQVTPRHQEILQLNVSNRFDLSGQIRAASSQARLQSLADEFILGEYRNARILRAQTIYFNMLRAQHQVEVAQAARRNARQQESDAAKLYLGQIGAKIDLYRAQTQVANAEANVSQSENTLSIAQNSYNDLMGRPLDSPVSVDDVPGVTVGEDIAASPSVGAPTPGALTPYSVPPGEIGMISIAQSLRTANGRRPEILAAQVNVRVAETGVKLARAGLEPSFSLSAAGNYYPTPSFQFPRQRTAQLTAVLSIPLYDGGATRDRVDEARLRTDNARTSLASTQSDVALDVRQSYLNLATAARQIDAANAALKSAVAARQLAQIRYAGQVGLYLEVTDAQAALVQAENAQVDAVYNYLVARAQFENSVGTPQFPQAVL